MSLFKNGIQIGGVRVTHGKEFHVNNSGVLPDKGFGGTPTNASGAQDGSFLRPLATLAQALAKCVANRGDTIYLGAGHVETISASGALAISVAGVKVIGLGSGSKRATVNITHTGGFLSLAAANVEIHNILVTGGVDAITKCISVSAADCVINECEIRDVTGQVTDGILTTAAADRLKILKHVHRGDSAAGTNSAIALVGGTGIEITADRIDGNFAVSAIDIRTTATTDLFIHDVAYARTRNSADLIISDTITGSTGQMGPNIFMRLQDNAANITEAITGATFVVMDVGVHVVNAAGEKSIAINWTASTDA